MTNKRTFSTRYMILCALFSALIGVGAFIKIPVPVLPFTLQFLFTNLGGLILGKYYGAISSGVYVAIGLLGFPIFTQGGGIGYIFQPTFGYLVGFIVGAWVAGFTVEKRKKKDFKTMLTAGFANLAVVYTIGMIYYYLIANYYTNSPIGVSALIVYCFVLCVPGDIALCIISAIIGKRLYPVVNKGGKQYVKRT